MKNILILGSSGQIGSHLVKFFKKKNYNVSEFDIETNKNVDIQIKTKKLKDLIQVNKRNKVNKYFLKFWKPKTSIQDGINSIVHHYIK